jgi:hypothetical protein
MRFQTFSFGSIVIDGVTYDHERGDRSRPKKTYPGSAAGSWSVPEPGAAGDGRGEARGAKAAGRAGGGADGHAISRPEQEPADTNAILHVTC